MVYGGFSGLMVCVYSFTSYSARLRGRRAAGPRPVPGLQQAHPAGRENERDCGRLIRTLLHTADQRRKSLLHMQSFILLNGSYQ